MSDTGANSATEENAVENAVENTAENTAENTVAAQPEAPEAPEAPEPAEAPETPEAPLRRGRLAAVAGTVLLAVALVAGVGYTVVTVNGADHDAGAPVWKVPPEAKESGAKKAPASALAGMLVPYGTDGLTRGPDIERYGSDAALNGREAADNAKASLQDLPRTQRLRLEQQIDKQHIKGLAMRSYLSGMQEGATGLAHNGFTMDITLLQLENNASVRNASDSRSALLGSLYMVRKGPEIQGYKDAHCFLAPKDAHEKLDSMFCTAYQGDVLVTATVSAAKPLDTKGAARLLRTQLDHIADPGEAV